MGWNILYSEELIPSVVPHNGLVDTKTHTQSAKVIEKLREVKRAVRENGLLAVLEFSNDTLKLLMFCDNCTASNERHSHT